MVTESVESKFVCELLDFSRLSSMIIIASDADAYFGGIRSKRLGLWGAEPLGPITSPIRYSARCAAFVKLYDSRPHSGLVYIGLESYTHKTNRTTGVSKRRGCQQFINKFTVHGKKARSSKFYGKALAALLIAYKGDALTSEIITAELSARLGIYFTAIATPARASLIIDAAFQSTSVNEYVKALSPSITNTELAFERLQSIVPVYSYVVSKIDKARFKNSRGKSGRYEMKLKFIPQDKGVNYMFKYLKNTWNFSKESTYFGKYVDVLVGATLQPKRSLGFILGRRAFLRTVRK